MATAKQVTANRLNAQNQVTFDEAQEKHDLTSKRSLVSRLFGAPPLNLGSTNTDHNPPINI
jgi:hypothetical protein